MSTLDRVRLDVNPIYYINCEYAVTPDENSAYTVKANVNHI